MKPVFKAISFNAQARAYRAVLGDRLTLGQETRALVDSPPPPSTWVDGARAIELFDAAYSVLGEEQIFEIGRKSVLQDLKGVYKIFVRVLAVEHVMSRGGTMYNSYWKDNGVCRARLAEKQRMLIEFDGVVCSSKAMWTSSRGALFACLEATRVKAPAVHQIEDDPKAGRFAFLATWG